MQLHCPHCDLQREVAGKDAEKMVKCPSCGISMTSPAGVEEIKSPDEPGGNSIDEFVKRTGKRDMGQRQRVFELERDRLLGITLDGLVWIKRGSMVSCFGDITFTRAGILEHGLGKLIKKALTGEGVRLSKAEGTGKLYLADSGKQISILKLNNEAIFVNGKDLLAFEDSMSWDIKMTRKVTGMMAAGLFGVKLEGKGMVAITTRYEPLTLKVTPSRPIITNPKATVAWSSSLATEMKRGFSGKTFLGRGSGESIQMKFVGSGFVVVQPFAEVYPQQGS